MTWCVFFLFHNFKTDEHTETPKRIHSRGKPPLFAKDSELLEPLIPTCPSYVQMQLNWCSSSCCGASFRPTARCRRQWNTSWIYTIRLDHWTKRYSWVLISWVVKMIPRIAWVLSLSLSVELQLICFKARYMICIFDLLNAPSNAVKYEAATTLTALTQNPAAVEGPSLSMSAAFAYPTLSCRFINLVIKEPDNNVKLIVLDRLDTLCSKHSHVLDGLIMDVLQTLTRWDLLGHVLATRLTET